MRPEERQKVQRLYELYEQPMYRIAYAFLHDSSQAEDGHLGIHQVSYKGTIYLPEFVSKLLSADAVQIVPDLQKTGGKGIHVDFL